MGQKHSSAEAALYRAISDVLLYEWDPCCVADYPEAHDEYHSYLPHVYKLVQEDAGAKVIEDYLWEIEVHRMGLEASPERLSPIAEQLAALRSQHSGTALSS